MCQRIFKRRYKNPQALTYILWRLIILATVEEAHLSRGYRKYRILDDGIVGCSSWYLLPEVALSIT
jgi:hypothetical protein